MPGSNEVRADIELRLKKLNVADIKGGLLGNLEEELAQRGKKIFETGGAPTGRGPTKDIFDNIKDFWGKALKVSDDILRGPTGQRLQAMQEKMLGMEPTELKKSFTKYERLREQLVKESWKKLGGVIGYEGYGPKGIGSLKYIEEEVAGIPNVRQRKAAQAMVDELKQLPQTFEQSTEAFRNKIEDFGETVEKSSTKAGFRISYIASTVNSALSVARSIAEYTKVSETTFNLESPQAMGSALMQREMALRTIRYSNIGRAVGQIAGAFAGASMGPVGAFMGSYIGGNIGGSIGDILSTFQNIPEEQKMQVFNAMWGWAGRNEQPLEQLQSTNYQVAGRFGRRYQAGRLVGGHMETDKTTGHQYMVGQKYQLGAFDYGYTKTTGLNMPEYEQYMGAMAAGRGELNEGEMAAGIRTGRVYGLSAETLGAFETVGRINQSDTAKMVEALNAMTKRLGGTMDGMLRAYTTITERVSTAFVTPEKIAGATAYMMNLPSTLFPENKAFRTPETAQGQQVINAAGALLNPANEAQSAFIWAAISRRRRQLGQTENPLEIELQKEQGLMNPQNLMAFMDMLSKNPGMASNQILAMLVNKGVSPEIARRMAESMGTEAGRTMFKNQIETETLFGGLSPGLYTNFGKMTKQKQSEILKNVTQALTTSMGTQELTLGERQQLGSYLPTEAGQAQIANLLMAMGKPAGKLEDVVPPGMQKSAEIWASEMEAAAKVQGEYLDKQATWVEKQNEMIGNGQVMFALFDESLALMEKIFQQVLNPKGETPKESVEKTAKGEGAITGHGNMPMISAMGGGALALDMAFQKGFEAGQDLLIPVNDSISVSLHLTATAQDSTGKKAFKSPGRIRK